MAETVYPRAYGVAEINYYIKEYLGEDDFLSHLAVSGEISNFKHHSSGHIYFTLKEGESSLKAVCFRGHASMLTWMPNDGDKAVAIGGISLYERDGNCQLYVDALLPLGIGAEAKKQDQLRKALEEEGLFALERKRPLPRFPLRIGVITSAEGAAWSDIRRIAATRFPGLPMCLHPAIVQGEKAAASLLVALHEADRAGYDLLIIGRGGGSEMDLSAFNNEILVRAVANSTTPVIAAIGHESDFSLVDLAADFRAATPTHAATIAVPELHEILAMLTEYEKIVNYSLEQALLQTESRLKQAELSLLQSSARVLREKGQQLAQYEGRLSALNPEAVLNRGYSIALDESDNTIRSASQLNPGQSIILRLAEGSIEAQVIRIIPVEKEGKNDEKKQ